MIAESGGGEKSDIGNFKIRNSIIRVFEQTEQFLNQAECFLASEIVARRTIFYVYQRRLWMKDHRLVPSPAQETRDSCLFELRA
jgi:hypothetical protein